MHGIISSIPHIRTHFIHPIHVHVVYLIILFIELKQFHQSMIQNKWFELMFIIVRAEIEVVRRPSSLKFKEGFDSLIDSDTGQNFIFLVDSKGPVAVYLTISYTISHSYFSLCSFNQWISDRFPIFSSRIIWYRIHFSVIEFTQHNFNLGK